MTNPINNLPALPEVGFLGDDVSYGYDAADMRDYALEAVAAALAPAREKSEPAPVAQEPAAWIYDREGSEHNPHLMVAGEQADHLRIGSQFLAPNSNFINWRPLYAAPTAAQGLSDALDALRDLEAMAERYRPQGYPIPDAQKRARAILSAAQETKP